MLTFIPIKLRSMCSVFTVFIFIFLSLNISNVAANNFESYELKKLTDRIFVIHGSIDLPTAENKGFI